MFIAQVLVGPSKQLKRIIQIEQNIVKNPNWPEANQLAIYKRGRGFELGATEKQIQIIVRAGLEPETAGLRVQHSDHSAISYNCECQGRKLRKSFLNNVSPTVLQTDFSSDIFLLTRFRAVPTKSLTKTVSLTAVFH